MRRLVDTFVLVCLLVGPALVLTCVRQPDATEMEQVVEHELDEEEEPPYDMFVYNDDFPRP